MQKNLILIKRVLNLRFYILTLLWNRGKRQLMQKWHTNLLNVQLQWCYFSSRDFGKHWCLCQRSNSTWPWKQTFNLLPCGSNSCQWQTSYQTVVISCYSWCVSKHVKFISKLTENSAASMSHLLRQLSCDVPALQCCFQTFLATIAINNIERGRGKGRGWGRGWGTETTEMRIKASQRLSQLIMSDTVGFVDFIVNVVLSFRNTSNQFYKMATKRLLAQHGTLCIQLTVSYW